MKKKYKASIKDKMKGHFESNKLLRVVQKNKYVFYASRLHIQL